MKKSVMPIRILMILTAWQFHPLSEHKTSDKAPSNTSHAPNALSNTGIPPPYFTNKL